jgi:hypothetical protein
MINLLCSHSWMSEFFSEPTGRMAKNLCQKFLNRQEILVSPFASLSEENCDILPNSGVCFVNSLSRKLERPGRGLLPIKPGPPNGRPGRLRLSFDAGACGPRGRAASGALPGMSRLRG